jgi:hypothetical protein
MNLSELQAVAEKLQNSIKRDEALEGMLTEASTALADILAHLEKAGPDQAKAFADALKGVKLQIETKSDAAVVNVAPTPVTVRVIEAKAPTVNVQVPQQQMPAPVVNVQPTIQQAAIPKGSAWRCDIKRDPLTDQMQSFTITKL